MLQSCCCRRLHLQAKCCARRRNEPCLRVTSSHAIARGASGGAVRGGLRSAVEDRSATCSVASEEGDEVRRRTRKWGGRGNSDGDGDEGFEGPRGEGAAWRRPITGAEGEAGEADGCCSGVPPFGTVPSSTAPGRSPRRRCGTFGMARAPY